MTAFIEKHFKGLVILLLLILCLLLYARRNNGRYMLCPDASIKGVVYVLDTKTSKLWMRNVYEGISNSLYWGTNNKPQAELIIQEKKSEDKNPNQ